MQEDDAAAVVRGQQQQQLLPVGMKYMFVPTDEQLIEHYLWKKVAGVPIDPSNDPIPVFDVYTVEPWHLPRNHFNYATINNEMYFFSPRHPTTENGQRAKRTAGKGFWDGHSRDERIEINSRVIGHNTSLTFKIRNGNKNLSTNWLMHEYLLHSPDGLFQEWAICKIYENRKGKKDQEKQPLLKRKRMLEPAASLINRDPMAVKIPIEEGSMPERAVEGVGSHGMSSVPRIHMECPASSSQSQSVPTLASQMGGLACPVTVADSYDGCVGSNSTIPPPRPPSPNYHEMLLNSTFMHASSSPSPSPSVPALAWKMGGLACPSIVADSYGGYVGSYSNIPPPPPPSPNYHEMLLSSTFMHASSSQSPSVPALARKMGGLACPACPAIVADSCGGYAGSNSTIPPIPPPSPDYHRILLSSTFMNDQPVVVQTPLGQATTSLTDWYHFDPLERESLGILSQGPSYMDALTWPDSSPPVTMPTLTSAGDKLHSNNHHPLP